MWLTGFFNPTFSRDMFEMRARISDEDAISVT